MTVLEATSRRRDLLSEKRLVQPFVALPRLVILLVALVHGPLPSETLRTCELD